MNQGERERECCRPHSSSCFLFVCLTIGLEIVLVSVTSGNSIFRDQTGYPHDDPLHNPNEHDIKRLEFPSIIYWIEYSPEKQGPTRHVYSIETTLFTNGRLLCSRLILSSHLVSGLLHQGLQKIKLSLEGILESLFEDLFTITNFTNFYLL